jgi:serine/threonine-protein kinase
VQVLADQRLDRSRSTVVSLGSPVYQSPEQLMGHVMADPASDVYALGCILFEMVAGQPPFGGRADAGGVLRKLQEAPRRLRQLRETVPADLEELVHTSLARHAADRFVSMQSLQTALAGIVLPRRS